MNESEKQKAEYTEKQKLRAKQVREVLGLTYRQLNDWEAKGVIPKVRDSNEGWRHYTAREFFTIMVCKEIRDKFGVPLESLKFVSQFMLQEGANHYLYALETIITHGLTMHLLTDLKETFIMSNDLDFEDMLRSGYFRTDLPHSYIFIKINPIINRMLSVRGLTIKNTNKVYDKIYEEKLRKTVFYPEEIAVLDLVRNKKYTNVTIKMNDGKIKQIDTEEELNKDQQNEFNNDFPNILKEKDYQSVTVKVHDGRVVRITRKNPIKFNKAAEKIEPK